MTLSRGFFLTFAGHTSRTDRPRTTAAAATAHAAAAAGAAARGELLLLLLLPAAAAAAAAGQQQIVGRHVKQRSDIVPWTREDVCNLFKRGGGKRVLCGWCIIATTVSDSRPCLPSFSISFFGLTPSGAICYFPPLRRNQMRWERRGRRLEKEFYECVPAADPRQAAL